jgi:hypothetical protein
LLIRPRKTREPPIEIVSVRVASRHEVVVTVPGCLQSMTGTAAATAKNPKKASCPRGTEVAARCGDHRGMDGAADVPFE